MLFYEQEVIPVSGGPSETLARLQSATATPLPLWGPMKVKDFLAEYRNKKFVGRFRDGRFKIILLPDMAGRWRVRRGLAVVLGEVQPGRVVLAYRVQFFSLVFSLLYFAFVFLVSVLSRHGPQSETPLPWILAAAAFVVPAVVHVAFKREVRLARKRLKEALGLPSGG